MSEERQPKSIKERMATCPIHKWANIDDYLKRAQVPPQFIEPFHELVWARGLSPKNMSREQGKQFGPQAVKIINQYNIGPEDAQKLKVMFGQLIEQWISDGSQSN